MVDHYVEVLVKRDSEASTKKIIMRICMAVMFLVAFLSAIPLFYFLTLILAMVYYFALVRANVEFEYFYMDGELDIVKVMNQSRRKNVISIKDEMVQMVAPANSGEIERFSNYKAIDCSAKNSQNRPYAIICNCQGAAQKVLVQMNAELLNELQLRMKDKVVVDVQ